MSCVCLWRGRAGGWRGGGGITVYKLKNLSFSVHSNLLLITSIIIMINYFTNLKINKMKSLKKKRKEVYVHHPPHPGIRWQKPFFTPDSRQLQDWEAAPPGWWRISVPLPHSRLRLHSIHGASRRALLPEFHAGQFGLHLTGPVLQAHRKDIQVRKPQTHRLLFQPWLLQMTEEGLAFDARHTKTGDDVHPRFGWKTRVTGWKGVKVCFSKSWCKTEGTWTPKLHFIRTVV